MSRNLLPNSISKALDSGRESGLFRLSQTSFNNSTNLSLAQIQNDRLVSSAKEDISDWKGLLPLIPAGLSFRASRLALLGAGGRLPFAIRSVPGFVRGGSSLLAIGVESAVYEVTHRTLVGLDGTTLDLLKWHGKGRLKEGWGSSFVNFLALKGMGRLAQGQNGVVQHGAQAFGMVGAHHLVYRVGFGEAPEGTLTEQFAHAEIMNLKLLLGMAGVYGLTGGRLEALEKGMEHGAKVYERRVFGGGDFLSGSGLVPVMEGISPRSEGIPKIDTKALSILNMSVKGPGDSGKEKGRGSPASHPEQKRALYQTFAQKHGVALDTWLGRLYGKEYVGVAQVNEALEILFGDVRETSRPLDEIHWIQSYRVKGGYPRIRAYLRHDDSNVRIVALRALVEIRPRQTYPELTELLEPYLERGRELTSVEETEIVAIAEALTVLGVPPEILKGQTRPYLRILNNHKNRTVSTAAEAASILLDGFRVIPDYRVLLESRRVELRIQALSILKVIKTEKYRNEVVACLSDPEPKVRLLAAEILAERKDSNSIFLLGVVLREDADLEVRKTAARLLGRTHNQLAVEDLLTVFENPKTDPELAAIVARSLGLLTSPIAPSHLREALKQPDPELRYASALALTRIRMEREALPVYREMLTHPKPQWRVQALEGLLELRKETAKTVYKGLKEEMKISFVRLLNDKDGNVRRLAARVLDKFEPGWAQETLGEWEELQRQIP